jgi:peptidoglycan hydrolase-like protein with peptidoglycan-binding domain
MYKGLFVLAMTIVAASTAVPQAAKTASKKAASKKKTTKKKAAPAATWRTRQMAPTPERYKDIQQALAAKGYLKEEPNGVWDDRSTEALRQFQSDQKLTPTGKINSQSLIGLGLGPRPEETPTDAPAPAEPRQ